MCFGKNLCLFEKLKKAIKLKSKILITFFLTAVLFGTFSFNSYDLKKRITDKSFRYEFYTTHENVKVKTNRFYYWFKGGAIHSSEFDYSGELLEGGYEKFYLNNQLAEKGSFKKGLKVGLWKTWHTNGAIETKQNWKNGQKSGVFLHYNDQGELIEKGRFRGNKKHGRWHHYKTKDTLNFKENSIVKKLTKKEKDSIQQKKKEQKEIDKVTKKHLKEVKAKEKSDKKEQKKQASELKAASKSKEPKKESFRNKLFPKKEKSPKKSDVKS